MSSSKSVKFSLPSRRELLEDRIVLCDHWHALTVCFPSYRKDDANKKLEADLADHKETCERLKTLETDLQR